MSYKQIKGSWYKTAKNISYKNDILRCSLRTKNGRWLQNKVKCIPGIKYENDNGVLKCANDKNVKVAILLTTCFRKNSEYKKNYYYNRALTMWSITGLPVFVVESSNYSFNKFKHLNIKTCSTSILNEPSSTQYETKSILFAMDFFKEELKDYTHILKITGRYFLDIKSLLANIPNVDLILQHNNNRRMRWNNSEVFGFRIGMEKKIFKQITEIGLFEQHIYKESKKYSFIRLPPIPNIYRIRRGGDNKLLREL